MKLEIGKEYEVQNRFAVLEEIQGTGQFATAVLRDRWDNRFECDIGYVQEKQPVKKASKKK
jgi:hypothetical protein